MTRSRNCRPLGDALSFGGELNLYPIPDKLPFEVWLCRYYPDETYIPSDYLLCCVVSGNPEVIIDNITYGLHEGDIILIQPEEAYGIRSNEDFLVCVLRMEFYFMVRCCDYERPSFLETPQKRILSAHITPELRHLLREKIYFLADIFFEEPKIGTARQTYYF